MKRAPVRARRSLTHVGGNTETWGDGESVEALVDALAVLGSETETGEAAARAHVHGFHTYPARLHPDTAARLVRALSPEGGTVLDPFCGSGTVLIEGLLAGRNVIGTDLNPLAILLARVKAEPMTPEVGERIVTAARAIAEAADERRKTRAGATRRLPPEDVATFDPHVLLELDGLRTGIQKIAPGPERDALCIVLGALLVKVSRKRGDTATGEAPKRIASGYTLKFFVKKTQDLVQRRAELTALLPTPRPKSSIKEDDATELRTVGASSVDAIITSPPYAATYDYLEHHALRMRWLGLDSRRLEENEMGARRAYARLTVEGARTKWLGELTSFLRAAARVVRPGGAVILVVADSAVRGERSQAAALRADDLVAEAMAKLPFEPVARASQARPHFHGPTSRAFDERSRYEHALFLRRVRG